MTVLSAREGYRLWAPSYADETAISFLEIELAAALTPPLEGKRLLDAGCGTGRRLHGTGAALAIGVDLSPEMLACGARGDPRVETMVADVRNLPLPDRAFDVIWCRLVIGHLPDCTPVYAELARVADAGARLVITDFHPAAWDAGHRRTFRQDGQVHEIEHYVHDYVVQAAAAKAAGWQLKATQSAVIGPDARPFYEKAGRAALYAEHEGLPVVLGLAFEREG
ncbi:MAG TPA: class I SAM-dependent methyltransferase [Caulobacteraceae bacterium]|jgi:malonyl-CoA O-methyltransferase